MEINYDKETDSKYVQIKKGVVTHTKEKMDWLFFDCNKKGEVIGVEILNASEHPINLITLNDTLVDCSLEEKAPSLETIRRKAISSQLVKEASQKNIGQIQLVF